MKRAAQPTTPAEAQSAPSAQEQSPQKRGRREEIDSDSMNDSWCEENDTTLYDEQERIHQRQDEMDKKLSEILEHLRMLALSSQGGGHLSSFYH